MNSSPALEIPEWMFDPGICSQMKQESEAHVSSVALLALKSLLSTGPYPVESMVFEAQHLSSSSGDADAFAVTLEDRERPGLGEQRPDCRDRRRPEAVALDRKACLMRDTSRNGTQRTLRRIQFT